MKSFFVGFVVVSALLPLLEAHNLRSMECWQGGPQQRELVHSSYSHCQFTINTDSGFFAATTRHGDFNNRELLKELAHNDIYNCGVKWSDHEVTMIFQCSCYRKGCNWPTTLKDFFYSGLNIKWERQTAENIDEQIFA